MQQNKKSPSYLIASVKDADIKLGIVTGYLAAFNNLDSDNDTIMPGAFAKTIAEMGPASARPRIKYLLDHDTTKALGVFNVLQEDNKGLYYEAQVGTHNLGRDYLQMVSSGLITEHSIGYGVVKKEIINPDADWYSQQTSLIELKLYEGSALQFLGANPDTPLTGVKARKCAENRIPKLITALKNGEFTEKTFFILEKELLFLQQAFSSDYGTTEPEGNSLTTQPNDEEKNLLNEISIMRTRLAFIH